MSMFADPNLERICAESLNERARRPLFVIGALSTVFGSIFLIVLNALGLERTEPLVRANVVAAALSIGGGLLVVLLPFSRFRLLIRYFDIIMVFLMACNFIVHVLPFALTLLAPEERRSLGWLAQVTILFATLSGFRLPAAGVYLAVTAILGCYCYAVAVQHEAPLIQLALCGSVAISTPLALRMTYVTDGYIRGNFREIAERVIQLSELSRRPPPANRGRSTSFVSLGSIRVSAASSAERSPGSNLHRAFELPHDVLDAHVTVPPAPSSPACGPAPPSPGSAGAGGKEGAGAPPALDLPPPAVVLSLDGSPPPPEERAPRPPSRAPPILVVGPPSPEPRSAWATPRGSHSLAAATAAGASEGEQEEEEEEDALVAPIAEGPTIDGTVRDAGPPRPPLPRRRRRARLPGLPAAAGVPAAAGAHLRRRRGPLRPRLHAPQRLRGVPLRREPRPPPLCGGAGRHGRPRPRPPPLPRLPPPVAAAPAAGAGGPALASLLPWRHPWPSDRDAGGGDADASRGARPSRQVRGALPVAFAFGGYAVAGHSLLGPLNILTMYVPLWSGLQIVEAGMRFMFASRVYRYKQVAAAAQRAPEGPTGGLSIPSSPTIAGGSSPHES